MRKAAVVVFYLLSVIVAAELSARSAMRNQLNGFEAQLAEIQAMLTFNHLERYRELEGNLAKGCSAAVLEKLKISAATESMLLSSYLRDHPGSRLGKQVAERAPELAAQLAEYKSPYGSSWTEPKCE